MGEIVSLTEHHADRGAIGTSGEPRWPVRPAFLFDLGSPSTYLAAERAERLFPGLAWRPASARVAAGQTAVRFDPAVVDAAQMAAERRAAVLRIPLVWPDRYPFDATRAMRVASLAAEQLRAAPFVLAASRLAFCGGFDLDDPETLAEAAAAAGLGLDAALAAARDGRRDAEIEAEALRLRALGGDRVPAVVVHGTAFAGERRLDEAAAVAAGRACALGPVGRRPSAAP